MNILFKTMAYNMKLTLLLLRRLIYYIKKILIKTLSERASETRQQKMILFSLTLNKIIFPVTQLAVYKECVIFVVCKMVYVQYYMISVHVD